MHSVIHSSYGHLSLRLINPPDSVDDHQGALSVPLIAVTYKGS